MMTFPEQGPPPRPRKTSGPWVPLLCVALGFAALWLVTRLSPDRNVSGDLRAQLEQIRLPDFLQFLEGRTDVVVVSCLLAVVLWMMFRRPRSR